MPRPKGSKNKILESTKEILQPVAESPKLNLRDEVLKLLKAKMPACFDREPQGMNSGVDKLADEINKLYDAQ